MSRRKIKAGTTSVMLPIFILDTSSSTGAGLSVAFNTAGLVGKYRRRGDSSWTTITIVTATLGSYTSGGFVADSAGFTGGVEVGIPDAALATGASWVEVVYYGVTNMLPVLIEIELDTIDYQSSGGKVPATLAAADVSGNLPVDLQTIKGQTITCAGAVTVYAHMGTAAANTAQTGDSYAIVSHVTNGNAAIKTAVGTPMQAGSTVVLTDNSLSASKIAADALLAIANKVESEIIDETDSEKVLTAITDKIASVNPSLAGLTLSAIASAVWANVTRTLTGFSFTVNTNANATELAIDAKTTNLPPDPADESQIEAAVAALSALVTNRTLLAADYLDTADVLATVNSALGSTGLTAFVSDFNTMIEVISGSNKRFKAAALSQAPSGGGGGGDITIIEVLPLQSNVPSVTIIPSGDTEAFQYSPLPTGPIAIFQADGITPVDLSGNTLKMECVCKEFPSKTFILGTHNNTLTIGGTNNNQISVDYTPLKFGRFHRKTWRNPGTPDKWYFIEEGYWQIREMPNPVDIVVPDP